MKLDTHKQVAELQDTFKWIFYDFISKRHELMDSKKHLV